MPTGYRKHAEQAIAEADGQLVCCSTLHEQGPTVNYFTSNDKVSSFESDRQRFWRQRVRDLAEALRCRRRVSNHEAVRGDNTAPC